VSKSKLYDSVRSGELRAVHLGRRVVIPCDEIEALVGPVTVARNPEQLPSPVPSQAQREPSTVTRGGSEGNAVHLTGTVVRQPKLRMSRIGLEVCTLQLAVARRSRDGEERGALYVDAVAFGAAAAVGSTLSVGDHVALSGRLGQREWTSGDGSQHARFEVVADEIERSKAPGASAVAVPRLVEAVGRPNVTVLHPAIRSGADDHVDIGLCGV
jgi:primosomal replication protein N